MENSKIAASKLLKVMETDNRITVELPNGGGYLVRHDEYNKDGFLITDEELERIDMPELIRRINRGQHVEQYTRVTGYMTKVSGMNAGKRAELKDRYRSGVSDNENFA